MKQLLLACATFVVFAPGCYSPAPANIKLRKENQDLTARIADLERQLGAAKASISGFESTATTVPVLPNDRLNQLYTVHGLQVGRITGEFDLDKSKPGNEGLKLYVIPTDQHGQPLKASGTFTIDAFDLSRKDNNRIGHWEFPPERGQENFYSMLMLYTYAFPLPWQQLPKDKHVTLRVSFRDALTGRAFSEEKTVDVNLGAATMPAATQPAR